jgi:hypothetical protein
MSRTALSGEYGKLMYGEPSTNEAEGTTGGTALSTAGWYLITQINDSTSGVGTGLSTSWSTGDLIYASTTGIWSLTASSASSTNLDKVKRLVETELADIEGWSVDASREEFEVTSLSDTVKKYLSGKVDLSGSLNGIRKIGYSDGENGIVNKFWKIVKISTGSTHTVYEANDDPVYVRAYTQKSTEAGETEEFYFMKVQLNSFNSGAQVGSRQEFTSNFRISGDGEPALYQKSH